MIDGRWLRARALWALSLCAACAGGEPSGDAPQTAPVQASANDDAVPVSRAGAELVGQRALPFAEDLQWIQGEPRRLEDLRGQVVLVRFWTDTCPFCEASAPGLSQLHAQYAGRGLVVLGLFHPKPRGSVVEAEAIAARAKELGMGFAIASDGRWDTLARWWLDAGTSERAATSVSFLIDAKGEVRWIHPGPEFHPDGPADHAQCRKDFVDAQRAIEQLLAERGAARG